MSTASRPASAPISMGSASCVRPASTGSTRDSSPANMGELTGEMGTVATFTRRRIACSISTLAPLEPLFREAGHVGWVNLNTIINDQGVWPLEFTCRFGYPGFAVLEPLQAIDWAEPVRAAGFAGILRFPHARRLFGLHRPDDSADAAVTQGGERARRPAGARRRHRPRASSPRRGRRARIAAGHRRPVRLDRGRDRDWRNGRAGESGGLCQCRPGPGAQHALPARYRRRAHRRGAGRSCRAGDG